MSLRTSDYSNYEPDNKQNRANTHLSLPIRLCIHWLTRPTRLDSLPGPPASNYHQINDINRELVAGI